MENNKIKQVKQKLLHQNCTKQMEGKEPKEDTRNRDYWLTHSGLS